MEIFGVQMIELSIRNGKRAPTLSLLLGFPLAA
jgi:hypothetical protein